jgi:hypothetical protein
VERRGQVQGKNRVPLGNGELVDRRNELDAGVVDEDVDRAELTDRPAHHRLDGVLSRHVGAVVANLHPVVGGELRAQSFDVGGVAEAIQNDVGAVCGELGCDA